MGTGQSPPFRRRQVGALFRGLRVDAGLSFAEALARAEMSAGRLSRLENGEVTPDIAVAKNLLDVYGVVTNDWPAILDQVREAKKKGWWQAYGLSAQGYIALETAASTVHEFALAFVPGLLQTEAYIRAVMTMPFGLQRTAGQLDNDVKARLIRQRRLYSSEDHLDLHVIIDESALTRPVGGSAILADQLRHIADMASSGVATIQIMAADTGAHRGMTGAFSVLSFANSEYHDIGYVEHAAGSVEIEKPDQVRIFRSTFEHLKVQAISPLESMKLLGRMASAS